MGDCHSDDANVVIFQVVNCPTSLPSICFVNLVALVCLFSCVACQVTYNYTQPKNFVIFDNDSLSPAALTNDNLPPPPPPLPSGMDIA